MGTWQLASEEEQDQDGMRISPSYPARSRTLSVFRAKKCIKLTQISPKRKLNNRLYLNALYLNALNSKDSSTAAVRES